MMPSPRLPVRAAPTDQADHLGNTLFVTDHFELECGRQMMNFKGPCGIKKSRFFAPDSMHHVTGDAAHADFVQVAHHLGGALGPYVCDPQASCSPLRKNRTALRQMRLVGSHSTAISIGNDEQSARLHGETKIRSRTGAAVIPEFFSCCPRGAPLAVSSARGLPRRRRYCPPRWNRAGPLAVCVPRSSR